MNKCRCGATSRTNYRFGKKNKSLTTFEIEHSTSCCFKKKVKRSRNNLGL